MSEFISRYDLPTDLIRIQTGEQIRCHFDPIRSEIVLRDRFQTPIGCGELFRIPGRGDFIVREWECNDFSKPSLLTMRVVPFASATPPRPLCFDNPFTPVVKTYQGST